MSILDIPYQAVTPATIINIFATHAAMLAAISGTPLAYPCFVYVTADETKSNAPSQYLLVNSTTRYWVAMVLDT